MYIENATIPNPAILDSGVGRPGINMIKIPKIAKTNADNNKAKLYILLYSININCKRLMSELSERTFVEYLTVVGKVLKDKAWYTLWNFFDLFENVERSNQQESYYHSLYKLVMNDPNHIIDNIYLGSAFNAADYTWLTNHNIKHIVNVTPSISNYYEDEFQYTRYDITDLNRGSLLPSYEDFYNKVSGNSDDFFLVHCFAGKSRSVALVLYYIMKKYSMKYDEAIEKMKEKRPGINLNTVFVNEIQELLKKEIEY